MSGSNAISAVGAKQPGILSRLASHLRRRFTRRPESNLVQYARAELERAGWFSSEGMYGDMMGHAVLNMVKQFADEGHSGMSAGIAIHLFEKVANFEPLTPLTGEDSEWGEPFGPDGTQQNKRCSHVFRDKGGRAYDSRAIVFREPSGCCYTSRDSRRVITFPYTPSTEYVDVPAPQETA